MSLNNKYTKRKVQHIKLLIYCRSLNSLNWVLFLHLKQMWRVFSLIQKIDINNKKCLTLFMLGTLKAIKMLYFHVDITYIYNFVHITTTTFIQSNISIYHLFKIISWNSSNLYIKTLTQIKTKINISKL